MYFGMRKYAKYQVAIFGFRLPLQADREGILINIQVLTWVRPILSSLSPTWSKFNLG